MSFNSGRLAIMQNAVNGALLLYEANPSTLVPIGTLHVYNGDGTLQGYDAVANISRYLPS